MSRLKKKQGRTGIKPQGKFHQKPNEGHGETPLTGQVLEESHNDGKQLLVESLSCTLELIESKGDKLIARGEFGRVDVPTQNGRIYPKKLMQREIERLRESLDRRGVLGELDHPDTGKTSLKRVSHVITDLKIDDTGMVIGECEILNTPEGKTLQALIAANIPVGVSSRGAGSTKPAPGNMKNEVVQEDFVLKTYDFVADPAMKTAIPNIYTEDIDDQTIADMFIDEFPEIAATLKGREGSVILENENHGDNDNSEDIPEDLAEEFEKKLAESLLSIREEVEQEIKESYDSDPDIGGAKAILANIAEIVQSYRAIPEEATIRAAIKAKDKKIAEMQESLDHYKKLYEFEKEISGYPLAESIRKIIKVKYFSTNEEIKDAIKSIKEQYPVDKIPGYVSENESSLAEENARLEGEISLLKNRANELNVKLKKVVKLSERIDKERLDALRHVEELEEQIESFDGEDSELATKVADLEEEVLNLELEVYKRDKALMLENGRQVLSLLKGINSKESVDRVVKGKIGSKVFDKDLREMLSSVKTKGQSNLITESEVSRTENNTNKTSTQENEKLRSIGVPDMAEMRRLARIGQQDN